MTLHPEDLPLLCRPPVRCVLAYLIQSLPALSRLPSVRLCGVLFNHDLQLWGGGILGSASGSGLGLSERFLRSPVIQKGQKGLFFSCLVLF